MKGKQFFELVNAKPIVVYDDSHLDREFTTVFASDLMSDALAMVDGGAEETVLVTGLMNVQSLRTAEMLDVKMILFVRGKQPNQAMIDMSKELGIDMYGTDLLMFETCGILYANGINGVK